MKFTIELTEEQMDMLQKRSQQLNSDPETLTREMLSVITDGSEEQFDQFMFMYAALDSPESLENLHEDDEDEEFEEDEEYEDEEFDDVEDEEFDDDEYFPEEYDEDWEEYDEEDEEIDEFLRKSRMN
ncbi:MAG: hypothetical protein ACLFQX_08800 [Candidatus Kapaibacterium sp.]